MTSVVDSLHSAIPASALDEEEEEEEDGVVGEHRDDERSGTRYNVRPFTHLSNLANFCTVRLVPCHICHGRDVRGYAAHRLVRNPLSAS
jgi:hypothetical protein